MAPSWIRLDRWTRNLVESLRPTRDFASLEGRPSAWSRAVSLAVAHPVVVAWIVGIPLAVFGYRHLITAPSLAGGKEKVDAVQVPADTSLARQ